MPNYKKKDFVEEKLFSKLWFFNYFLVILGSFFLAAGLVYFIIPFHIVPGGVFGISIIVNHLTGFPIGMLALVINIPLFLWGLKVLGSKFGLKTVLAIVLTSVGIDVITYFSNGRALTEDMLVSSIFGGVFAGLGIALVIRAGATTGGTDIIAQIISRYTKLPVGQMFLLIDGIIVLSSVIIFRKIDLAPYAIIAIFTLSKTVDAILTGLDHRKAVFIISEQYEKIRQVLLKDMDRGGTYIKAKGLFYNEEDRHLIFSALSRKELAALQGYIKRIDPSAFLIVIDTHEIIGSGFKPFK
ncbi:MAG: YitT family protein [bacterium]|nr:YitT family protein [bacterium]